MRWKVIDSGIATPEQNMTIDRQLLQWLAEDPQPVLHFYDWAVESATYGYFIDPKKFVPSFTSINFAKRPTGGGIVFHLWDLAYSVLVPFSHPEYTLNTLDNYAFVNRLVSKAVIKWTGASPELLQVEPVPLDPSCENFCMAKPTQNDVMINGRKVGGGAQRRTRHGFLHQGTISLQMPDFEYLQKNLLPCTCVVEAMAANSFALLPETLSKQQFRDAKRDLQEHLKKVITE